MREWIEANIDRLYGYAFSLAQDGDAARDLVQETVLRAMEARRRPGEAAAFRAWMFRILRNAFIDRCRRAGREVNLDGIEDRCADDDEPWAGDRRCVEIVMVRIALAKLTVAQREIVVLVDFVGCSYGEASKILDIPEGTVMSRLSRARRALLELVSDDAVTPLSRGAAVAGKRG